MIRPPQRRTVAALTLSAAALVGIVLHEGYTDRAVIPVKGDVPTIGFGTTTGVKVGDTTTPPKALARALTDVQQFEGALIQGLKGPKDCRQGLSCPGAQGNATGVHLVIPGIDADQAMAGFFPIQADGGDGFAGSQFNHQGALYLPAPSIDPHLLLAGTGLFPVPVTEHEDIGSGQGTTVGTTGQIRYKFAARLIHLGNEVVCRPDP